VVLYRRNRIAGGTYFFTVTLKDRKSALLVERIDDLREAFRVVKQTRRFRIEAMVILPEHLHAIWTLPPDDDDFSGRWRGIKAKFSHALAASGADVVGNARGEYDVWQSRFWEHTIRDHSDLTRHVEYIHYNPVKHGWVSRVRDWPHSTFHRYAREGVYPADWAGAGEQREEINYGE
jgi:putative transposase